MDYIEGSMDRVIFLNVFHFHCRSSEWTAGRRGGRVLARPWGRPLPSSTHSTTVKVLSFRLWEEIIY